MKFDLHTHHDRCGHAESGIRDYIEAALGAGMNVIGISDHSPYFESTEDHPNPRTAMAKSEFPRYIAEVLRLKEEYKDRIEVLLGLETDYFPEHMELHRKVYSQYPFDYIIGSVHWSGGIKIFDRKRWKGLTPEQITEHKDQYLDLIRQSAECGMFDVIGHMDALKANYPSLSQVPSKVLDEVLKVIAERRIAIEVNTSGKTKECGGWYPADDILERALYYGVGITFGSDAHRPDRVGDEWEQVRLRLKEIGFKEWVFFRRRQKQIVTL
ncbi:histidinol-phosphatase [Paenibacillus allorhizosphaerae]|uniref:Histidinol-phosphatase n=1 Tax=Paenibacillus allorhizosphaerae TaxID=2849866 RepID=A0ABM8VJB3_9BACL|nr:histidinol-phosphatase [Paenibacillus allorhizosphaerae]CAG7645247.1 Histidinol-phosphatase [Paenibacillus allorhizosphaerae]